jgi:hypothetical protein
MKYVGSKKRIRNLENHSVRANDKAKYEIVSKYNSFS